MVEIAARDGYPSTTIRAVSALAGVSRQTFYDLFAGDREACFLGAYDHVVARAAERINLAYCGEPDPERALCRAFEQFAREAATEPQAARFALIEALSAGSAALARMDCGRQTFEALIAASITHRAGESSLSPTITKGIVGGVERITRSYLLAGRIEELEAEAQALSAWVSSYRPWSRPAGAVAPEPLTSRPTGLRCRDERLRIVRAAAAIAARDGYDRLSSARISRLADVSEETFTSLYGGVDGVERCFLAAFDLLGVEALLGAAKATRHAHGWPEGVHRAITALLGHLAAHPFLGRVAFIEIFSVGPSAFERRTALLERFRTELMRPLPNARRPSELVADAIIGGIWTVIHDHVVNGQTHQLTELADDATYLALAPVIGHEAAVQILIERPGSVRGSSTDPA
jgi:AcrR family transcriptional regulator